MITNDEIDQFFSNLPQVLLRDKIEKEVKDKGPRTNILYLTTRCDFKCEYCYELKSRNDLSQGVDMTKADIDIFLDEIYSRERDDISSVVLFGGEPFLRNDLVEYAILKGIAMKKRHPFNFNVISNGSHLSNEEKCKNFVALTKFAESENCEVKVTLSYDGSGNDRRITQGGQQTSSMVLKAMENLRNFSTPFEISYTVHAGNYNKLEEDVLDICEKIRPSRLKLSWAFSDIDDVTEREFGFKLKEKMHEPMLNVFRKSLTPICHMVCGLCEECDFSKHKGNSYMSPTKGLLYSESELAEGFNLF